MSAGRSNPAIDAAMVFQEFFFFSDLLFRTEFRCFALSTTAIGTGFRMAKEVNEKIASVTHSGVVIFEPAFNKA